METTRPRPPVLWSSLPALPLVLPLSLSGYHTKLHRDMQEENYGPPSFLSAPFSLPCRQNRSPPPGQPGKNLRVCPGTGGRTEPSPERGRRRNRRWSWRGGLCGGSAWIWVRSAHKEPPPTAPPPVWTTEPAGRCSAGSVYCWPPSGPPPCRLPPRSKAPGPW